jgi:uncharacterized RDD family membrane protein YckC
MNMFSSARLSAFALLVFMALVARATRSAGTSPASLDASSDAVPAASSATAPSAAETPVSTPPPPAAPRVDAEDDDEDVSDSANAPQRHGREHRHAHRRVNDGDSDVVSIGHDSILPAGQRADSVVSILGSSTSAGEATDVVSVMGNTQVTGPVKDNTVSVLGSTYIDSKVDGDVVAVLGNVQLGPHAEIDGDVVAVLGTVKRDPAAIVHGGVQNVLDADIGDFAGLHAWIKHCLLYGRPLALVGGIGWAWTLALVFLAIYVCLALLFRPGVSACLETLETRPGRTALAALLAVLLTPILVVLLCFTVVGIAAVPFVVLALFGGVIFGTAVMLAWLGRVATNRSASVSLPAAVVIGGVIVIVLYLIPIVGFLVYKLIGIFGLGAVVYTLILQARAHQSAKAGPTVAATPAAAPAAAATTAAAAGDAGTTAEPSATPASSTAPDARPGPGPAFTAALPRAGFWIRMAALFLDVLLVGFVLKLLHPMGEVHLLVLAIYGAVMWKLRGSTVGGIVFDLHVVRLDGRPVGWETAIVRALSCFLSLAVVGLGFIWIAFDGAGQAWHDKIAGTVVVRAPKVIPVA